MHWQKKTCRLWRPTRLPIPYPAFPRNIGIWSKVQTEFLGTIIWKWTWAIIPGYQNCERNKYNCIHPKNTSPKRKKCHIRQDSVRIKTRKIGERENQINRKRFFLDLTVNLSSPTASVTTAKCVFNRVVSTPGVRCLLENIKHFYLNNILPDP